MWNVDENFIWLKMNVIEIQLIKYNKNISLQDKKIIALKLTDPVFTGKFL
jgi:hypothetical protein